MKAIHIETLETNDPVVNRIRIGSPSEVLRGRKSKRSFEKMGYRGVLTMVTVLLASSCALARGRKGFLPGQVVPFQPISSEEYNAILHLSKGSPMISEARLIGSGLSAIKDIASNIKNGAMTALNLTGLEPLYSSLFRPIGNRVQGYPLCVIRTTRLSSRSQKSFDTSLDPSDDSGAYSINYYHPGSSDGTDDDNDDNNDDDDDYSYPQPRPSRPSRRPTRPSSTTPSSTDDGDDTGNNLPVVNCVVVLKRPSSSTTPAPTSRPTRPTTSTTTTTRRPQYPNDPHGPHYPMYPYPIIPIPFPPYPGYPGHSGHPGSGGWPGWPGSGSSSSSSTSTTTTTTPRPTSWPHWPYPGYPSYPSYPGHPDSPGTPSWPRPHYHDDDDGDRLRHHYLGNGAKTALYDGATYDAPEIDDDIEINSDIGDVVDAIQTAHKKQTRRFRKNHLKVLPLGKVTDTNEAK